MHYKFGPNLDSGDLFAVNNWDGDYLFSLSDEGLEFMFNRESTDSNPSDSSFSLSYIHIFTEDEPAIPNIEIVLSSDIHEELPPNDIAPYGLVDDWLIA